MKEKQFKDLMLMLSTINTSLNRVEGALNHFNKLLKEYYFGEDSEESQ